MHNKAKQFSASVAKQMEEVFTDGDIKFEPQPSTFFTKLDRKKARQLIENNIARVVGPITKQYAYKVGRYVTDVWEFGNNDVVFGLYNGRWGGLVAMFVDKTEVEIYLTMSLRDQQIKDNRVQLREKAIKILKTNGFSDDDLIKIKLKV